AINPVNNKEIPIFVADYVLAGYGTGAIMAVPAHDERDFEFAKKYNLPVKQVIQSDKELPFCDEGININSDFLDGLETKKAKEKIIQWLEEKEVGKSAVNYKLKDWVFSRQRYWGEPIPIVHCEKCKAVAVNEKDLPVKLPEVENYEPSGTGESPLANITEWVNVKCPKCGGPAKRETNTMPQWAGSSWYYLRYIDPKNNNELVDKEKEKYWSPVDFYVGGAEHATRHLIYARFWHKFLYDIGAVNYAEPFTRLQHVGLINAEDGRKMSKRWGNVINPDEIVEKYGADSMRVYEMFMGPFSQPCAWNTNGLVGARKFLEKIYKISDMVGTEHCSVHIKGLLHKTIKKVGDDIQEFKFNTAISQMMIFVNELIVGTGHCPVLSKNDFEKFLIILSPFAPHLCEELWSKLENKKSIFKEKWPKYDKELIKDEKINLVIQVNGKLRDTIEVDANISEEEAKKVAMESEKIEKWVEGKEVVKVIYVKGKLVNVVVRDL
ncbi:MAG: leucine--tRNA ligase, partial [Candidatus Falkowbacteria bacterium]